MKDEMKGAGGGRIMSKVAIEAKFQGRSKRGAMV
jgi:hypothetical protein